jgi:cytochrome P450
LKTQASTNIHALHHNPSIFGSDHAVFDPTRWYDASHAKGKEKLLIPFSLGNRNCAGQNLANTNILKMVVTLLRFYEVEWLNRGEEMRVVAYGDSQLRTPILVKVGRRGEEFRG